MQQPNNNNRAKAAFVFTISLACSFFARAQGPCLTLTNTPSTDRNSITVTVPRINSYSPGGTYTNCNVMQTIQYYDGLGRPSQTVQQKASPESYDIVQAIQYDQYGRETKKYLPYTLKTQNIQGNGSFRTAAVTEQNSFYVTPPAGVTALPSNTAISETVFEPSPLNRPTEQGAPGAAWQVGTGHTVRISYGTNTANEIRKWNVYTGGASDGGFYAANTLQVTTTLDENTHAVVEYKDKEGRVVCKKVEKTGGYVYTYYIYDDYGNLAFVIPPLPSGVSLPASFDGSSTTFNLYMYGYQYDDRNRVVEKHIPGKAWEYMVYNMMDLVVATQDDVQRLKSTQEWTFMRYDGQGRLTQTGVYTHAGSSPGVSYRWDVQMAVNWTANQYDTYTGAGTYGYNQVSWPSNSAVSAYLTVNYYGRYDFPGRPSTYNKTLSTKTIDYPDALTGTRTRVLKSDGTLTGAWQWTVAYYDEKGRPVQTFKQHYKGAATGSNNYDRVDNTYNDFTGELTQSQRYHYVAGTNTLLVTTGYVYDHMGRKLRTTSTVGANTEVTLSRLTYNEVGQLREKSLHGNSSDVFLQNIAYTYNPRGWLSTAGSSLFAMQLNYNEESSNQYNGNISKQYWGTPGNLSKNYVYTYDAMNRMTSGTGSNSYSETGISYDDAGNIQSLTRTAPGTANTYTYSYVNNRLDKVIGISNNSYQYDASGRMTFDARNNTNVAYNLLNLPRNISGKSLTYVYDASGRKLQRKLGTVTTDYVDGIEYQSGAIQFVQTEEGRILNLTGTPNYEYALKDHLGNTRVTFESSTGGTTAKQVDDYYPFGKDIEVSVPSVKNKYLYNSKELQDGIGQYDYGARFYDPVIGRFTSVDPMAEVSRRWSTYQYGYNNPVRFTDIDGMIPGDFLNEDGQKVGSDGKDDGKLYLLKTTQKKFDSGAPSAGISKDAKKATEKFIKDNNGNSSAFEANDIAYKNSVEIEGKASTRQAMVDVVNQDNGNGGTADANNREYGGVVKTDGTVKQSPAGPVSDPTVNPNAHIDISSYDFQSTFHSHPSGTKTVSSTGSNPFGGTTIGGSTTSGNFLNAPSNIGGDVGNSGSKVNYVFSRGNGTVYIYNNTGVIGTVPQKYFVTPKQ